MIHQRACIAVCVVHVFALAFATSPPGPGPFGSNILSQPVPGAARAVHNDGWKSGKLCDVSSPPYSATNNSNATAALQQAIDDCGDLGGEGGTVLVKSGLILRTASLWLRSDLTLRVEAGATLLGTATGDMKSLESTGDAPIVYTRRNSLMVWAHAGLFNAGRCLEIKDPKVGWDDCKKWSKLSNVVIEGGGTLDANGDEWYGEYVNKGGDSNTRPMMLDLLWVDGLTVRNISVRRPGYWTIHPTFCNNVVVVNNDIVTYGHNTDGCDPDSSWNVYIAGNMFSTGDDCIAIKAGRDWSGRMINISTTNVLAERNEFRQGHGISIGSETSGWVRNVTFRDSTLNGTDWAVRIKSARGRGGGVENVLYENLTGTALGGVQLTLNYEKNVPKTNSTATPTIRGITVRNLDVSVEKMTLDCEGLDESLVEGILFDNVRFEGQGTKSQECSKCKIKATGGTKPKPECHVNS